MYNNIEYELISLEKSINCNEIFLDNSTPQNVLLHILLFEISDFTKLIIKLNKKRKHFNTVAQKFTLIPLYVEIYNANLRVYKKIIKNIENNSFKIFWKDEMSENIILNYFESYFQKNMEGNLSEVILHYLKERLNSEILKINCELYCLKNYTYEYINTSYTYIGPHNINRYRNERIFYKDCSITSLDTHSRSVSYNEDTENTTKNAILDILSYFNAKPYFLFTENPEFNRKLSELYEQFDFLDIIRLRNKSYFKSNYSESPASLLLPILNLRKNTDIIAIPTTTHEKIFSLYHASLKQFEPLPRCVFLYRVFEYGAKYHYQKIFCPSNYKVKDAINYYVSKIFNHNYTPLYYIEYGKANINNKNFKVKKKSRCINFITLLKKEAKKILIEWQNHPFLKSKDIGSIIYETGRNASAHASGGKIDARYDYSNNYKHINNVNIFLELIARYIVDELHPDYKKLVCRKHIASFT